MSEALAFETSGHKQISASKHSSAPATTHLIKTGWFLRRIRMADPNAVRAPKISKHAASKCHVPLVVSPAAAATPMMNGSSHIAHAPCSLGTKYLSQLSFCFICISNV